MWAREKVYIRAASSPDRQDGAVVFDQRSDRALSHASTAGILEWREVLLSVAKAVTNRRPLTPRILENVAISHVGAMGVRDDASLRLGNRVAATVVPRPTRARSDRRDRFSRAGGGCLSF